jgi:hypothetical protein
MDGESDSDTSENQAEARAHWADHCAICHANNGSGDTEIGRNLYHKPPDLLQRQLFSAGTDEPA